MNRNQILQLIIAARENGIIITLDNDNIVFKAKNGVSIKPEIIDELKDKKQIIQEFLIREQNSSSKTDTTDILKIDLQKVKYPPLSFSQESAWLNSKFNGEHINLIPFVFHLYGNLDQEALRFAFKTIVRRHEVFRTVIKENDGYLYQEIFSENLWSITIQDVQNTVFDLKEYLDEFKNRKFDFKTASSLQVELIRFTHDHYILIVIFNHISTDFFSEQILIKEITEVYNAKIHNLQPSLNEPVLRYVDYAVWQRENLNKGAYKKSLDFFKEELKDLENFRLTDEVFDHKIFNVSQLLRITLSKRRLIMMDAFLKEHGLTFNILNLSSLFLALYKYTGQKDFCIGIPVSIRTTQMLQNIVGYFINTIPLRGIINEDFTFIEFIRYIKDKLIRVMEHQEVPLIPIVSTIQHKKQQYRHPVFQIAYNHLDYSKTEKLSMEGIIIERKYDLAYDQSEFDMAFTTVVEENGTYLQLKYRRDYIAEGEASVLLNFYKEISGLIISDPDRKIKKILDCFDKETNPPGVRRRKYKRAQKKSELPEKQIQSKLTRFWSGVLEHTLFSMADNFFAVGGNSLLSVKLVVKIRKEFQVNFTVHHIYRFSTIENMAHNIRQKVLMRKYMMKKRKQVR